MKHKFFTLLFAILASLGTMFAQSGTCGDNLTWNLTDGVLTISGTGAMADYEWDGAPWYSNKESIKSVIIENGVTSIGDNAFYLCTGLTSIDIPNSVTSIESGAFHFCTGLTSVTIPESVTSIERSAFSDCSSLTSVTIPNSVTSIESSAFSGCSSLTSIDIPNSVTSIGEWAFSRCSSLTSINVSNGNANYCSVEGVLFNKDNTVLVQYPGGKKGNYTIPNSVTSIGSGAFSECTGLTSVTIGNSVTSIGISAFAHCSSLTSVTIPESVTSIERSAFSDCSSLTSVTIPNSVTSIGSRAFHGCTGLTSVTIPNSVTNIGDYAFLACSGLTSVTIPNSVTSIGIAAFSECTGLISVTNNASTPQSIVSNVFKDVNISSCTLYVPAESVSAYQAADVWKNFGTIEAIEEDTPAPCVSASGTCGENLTWELSCDSILTISGTGEMEDYQGPSYCPWYNVRESIKSLVINESCSRLGNYAFYHCINLTNATISNSVVSMGYSVFSGCENLISINLPENITSIEHGVFASCTNLPSIIIPNHVTTIETFAFAHCHNLRSVDIPSSVKNIGSSAFINCFTLDSLIIPNSVTSIGDWAFWNCGCTSLVISDSLTSIGNSVFGQTDMPYVNIPNSVTSIGNDAFHGSKLVSIDIPEGVISIGKSVFENSLSLSSVNIGKTVTNIGDSAFYYCVRLRSVTDYAIVPQTIDANVFLEVDLSACTLSVPTESLEAYKAADVWKEFGTIKAIEGEEKDYISIEEAIEIGMALDSMATTSELYTVEGYVINAGTFDTKRKEQTWFIADEENVTSSLFQAYRCYPIKGTDSVAVTNGDKVRMTGRLQKYYNRQTASFVVEMTYVPAIIITEPYVTDTITVAEALAIGAKLPRGKVTVPYVIRGYVSYIDTPFDDSLSIQSFYIADDISTPAVSNQTGGFYIYRGSPVTGEAIKEGAFVEITDLIYNYGDRTIENYTQNLPVKILKEAPECRTLSGTCGDNLTWTLNSCDGLFTMSGMGAMYDYAKGSAPWRYYEMTTAIIENGVTALGKYAFYGCSLSSVSIPASVTHIALNAFNACYNQMNFEVDGANPVYSSLDGVLFNKDQTTIVRFPRGRQGEYAIPEGVKIVGDGAFNACYLTNISIPEGVTSLGVASFYLCPMTSVSIPGTVEHIDTLAFCGCRLTSVYNYAKEPQAINADLEVFNSVDLTACTLYVPAESLEAYKAAEVWKEFGSILPIGEEPVETEEENFNVVYKGDDGKQIYTESITLHLPVAPEIEGFYFLKWQIVAGDLKDEIVIQAVYVPNDPSSAPDVYTNPANPVQKLVRNGNVYILTGDKVYTVTGQMVK